MNSLSRLCLSILSQRSWITVHQLHELVAQEKSLSLSSLYRILQDLEKEHIIIRKWSTIWLNTIRILEMEKTIADMKESYLSHSIEISQLDNWHPLSVSSRSFLDIDNIRHDVLGKVLAEYTTWIPIYFFNSHQYYLLSEPEKELFFLEKFKRLSSVFYYVIGNDSRADRQSVEKLTTLWCKAIASTDHPWDKEWYYVNVVWEYVLEFRLPQEIKSVMHDSCMSMTEANQKQLSFLKKSLLTKQPFRLTVTKNQDLAHSFAHIMKKNISY